MRLLRRSALEPERKASVVRAPSPLSLSREVLARMDWRSGELLAELYFQALGIEIRRRECYSQGLEMELCYPGQEAPYALAACRMRFAGQFGVETIDAFLQTCAEAGVKRGVLIVNRACPGDLHAMARAGGCKILDLDAWWEMLMRLEAPRLRPLQQFIRECDVLSPSCPHCALPLKEKTGRSGNRFLACPNYPRCNFTPLHALLHGDAQSSGEEPDQDDV